MLIFFKWLCAHLLGDFTLQTKTMVEHKRRYKGLSGYLYLHAAIHTALIYLFTGWWACWTLPLAVFVSHSLIDLWKLYRPDTLLYFILDQALHVLVLAGLWWWFQTPRHDAVLEAARSLIQNPALWITVAAYIFVIWPSAFLLGYLTQRWRAVIERRAAETPGSPTLSEAGRWIGVFERLLVLTFILTNHFEGIGFLIAAKSILRFGEIKGADSRAETEYILIGTLMSFSVSILTGLLCRHLLTFAL
jgi:hypothetical protein